jgi:hypothetical protein
MQSSYNAALFVIAAFSVIRNNTVKEEKRYMEGNDHAAVSASQGHAVEEEKRGVESSYHTALSAMKSGMQSSYIAACSASRNNAVKETKRDKQSSNHASVSNARDHAAEEEKKGMQSNDHAAFTAIQDQAVKGQDQEIHEDDPYVDYNLDNLNTLSINKDEEKYKEEESWEEYDTQTNTTTNDDQIHTSCWGKDWNEEEEEEIRKINRHFIRNEDEDEGTEQDTLLAVPDSLVSTENTPWPEDYQPLPENLPSRPEPETEQQAEGMRTRAKPPPPARESTGRVGLDQRKLPPAQKSTGQDQGEETLENKYGVRVRRGTR